MSNNALNQSCIKCGEILSTIKFLFKGIKVRKSNNFFKKLFLIILSGSVIVLRKGITEAKETNSAKPFIKIKKIKKISCTFLFIFNSFHNFFTKKILLKKQILFFKIFYRII